MVIKVRVYPMDYTKDVDLKDDCRVSRRDIIPFLLWVKVGIYPMDHTERIMEGMWISKTIVGYPEGI